MAADKITNDKLTDKPADVAPAAPAVATKIDFSPALDEVLNILRGLVSDVNTPELRDLISDVLADTARYTQMKIQAQFQDVKPAVLKSAEESLIARCKSVAAIPGLVAANKQQALIDRLTSVVTTIALSSVNVGIAMLTSQISKSARA